MVLQITAVVNMVLQSKCSGLYGSLIEIQVDLIIFFIWRYNRPTDIQLVLIISCLAAIYMVL